MYKGLVCRWYNCALVLRSQRRDNAYSHYSVITAWHLWSSHILLPNPPHARRFDARTPQHPFTALTRELNAAESQVFGAAVFIWRLSAMHKKKAKRKGDVCSSGTWDKWCNIPPKKEVLNLCILNCVLQGVSFFLQLRFSLDASTMRRTVRPNSGNTGGKGGKRERHLKGLNGVVAGWLKIVRGATRTQWHWRRSQDSRSL